MHAIAHRGVHTDTVRESALKVDPKRKIPCHTRESKFKPVSRVCQSNALPTELHPHPEKNIHGQCHNPSRKVLALELSHLYLSLLFAFNNTFILTMIMEIFPSPPPLPK